MDEFEEKPVNNLQLGSIDKDLVLKFRKQSKKGKFKQIEVLRILIEWWLSLELEQQKEMYYQTNKDLNLPDDQIEKLWTEMEKLGKKVGVKINKPKRK